MVCVVWYLWYVLCGMCGMCCVVCVVCVVHECLHQLCGSHKDILLQINVPTSTSPRRIRHFVAEQVRFISLAFCQYVTFHILDLEGSGLTRAEFIIFIFKGVAVVLTHR